MTELHCRGEHEGQSWRAGGGQFGGSVFDSGLSVYSKHVCVVGGGGKQAEGRTCYGGVKRKMKEVTYMF